MLPLPPTQCSRPLSRPRFQQILQWDPLLVFCLGHSPDFECCLWPDCSHHGTRRCPSPRPWMQRIRLLPGRGRRAWGHSLFAHTSGVYCRNVGKAWILGDMLEHKRYRQTEQEADAFYSQLPLGLDMNFWAVSFPSESGLLFSLLPFLQLSSHFLAPPPQRIKFLVLGVLCLGVVAYVLCITIVVSILGPRSVVSLPPLVFHSYLLISTRCSPRGVIYQGCRMHPVPQSWIASSNPHHCRHQ